MSKTIMFSTSFPKGYKNEGNRTFFVEKIYNELGIKLEDIQSEVRPLINDFFVLNGEYIKKHTIRGGNRFKAGDKFSPRIWSGKPYASKQIILARDIEIVKVSDIEIDFSKEKSILINGADASHLLATIAFNDGLSVEDFVAWFDKPFKGQIISWDENIIY